MKTIHLFNNTNHFLTSSWKEGDVLVQKSENRIQSRLDTILKVTSLKLFLCILHLYSHYLSLYIVISLPASHLFCNSDHILSCTTAIFVLILLNDQIAFWSHILYLWFTGASSSKWQKSPLACVYFPFSCTLKDKK